MHHPEEAPGPVEPSIGWGSAKCRGSGLWGQVGSRPRASASGTIPGILMGLAVDSGASQVSPPPGLGEKGEAETGTGPRGASGGGWISRWCCGGPILSAIPVPG